MVVPLYNHARYIAQAIQSVVAQGPIVGEIIVIDDGSTDDSARIMGKLAPADPRIAFWSHPNRGAHATINAGIMRASGEFVAILNSDDIYAPERLNRLVEVLDRSPHTGLACSAIAFIDSTNGSVDNPWYEAATAFYRTNGDLGISLVNGNFLMTTSNFLFRRSVLDRIGCFAPLRYAHDLDYALRLSLCGEDIRITEAPLLRYRLHDANTIKEEHARVRLEWAIVSAFYLHRRWEGGDWTSARAALDVLGAHRLTDAVVLAQAYFRRHPTDTLERNPILADQGFLDVLRTSL